MCTWIFAVYYLKIKNLHFFEIFLHNHSFNENMKHNCIIFFSQILAPIVWYTILYIYISKIRLRTSNPPMTSSVRFNTLRKEGWSTKIHIEIPNTTNAATWNEKSNFVIQMHCLPQRPHTGKPPNGTLGPESC